MVNLRSTARPPLTGLIRLAFAAAFIGVLTCAAYGQGTTTASKTPAGREPGAPAGSYALSEIERVNLYSGNLNFSLPLVKVGGRGGALASLNLSFDSIKWNVQEIDVSETGGGNLRMPRRDKFNDYYGGAGEAYQQYIFGLIDAHQIPDPWPTPTPPDKRPWGGVPDDTVSGGGPEARTAYVPTPVGWGELRVGYGPGVLQGRVTEKYSGVLGSGQNYSTILTRLTFTAPDGTEYELRDQATGGAPARVAWGNSYSRGRVFVAYDGSNLTFVSDQPLVEPVVGADFVRERYEFPTGYLLFADGTRYRIEGGLVRWVCDRNGNMAWFAYGTDPNNRHTYNQLLEAVDSLNRRVTLSYADMSQTFYDEIKFQGAGGAWRSIKVHRKQLNEVMPAGESPVAYGALFPGAAGVLDSTATARYYDPDGMISSVELPDGRSYSFLYNAWGEMVRVTLPAGGAIEYSHTPNNQTYIDALRIYRRVTERRVYPDGGTGDGYTLRQTYEPTYRGDGTAANPYLTDVLVEAKDGAGNTLESTRHHYYGYPVNSITETVDSPYFFYRDWKEGREYRTEALVAGAAARWSETDWDQPGHAGWWTSFAADGEPAYYPRVKETRSALAETGQVSRQVFGYDQFLNRTDVWEYDYGQTKLLRHTRTDYLLRDLPAAYPEPAPAPAPGPASACALEPCLPPGVPAAANGSGSLQDYRAHNLVCLPTHVLVEDGDGAEVSLTTVEYDDYTPESQADPHAALVARPDIVRHASTEAAASYGQDYVTRGNATRTTRWLKAGARFDAAADTPVSAYAQYDVAGNVVRAVDALGHATSFGFDDRFGAPDQEARANAAPAALGTPARVFKTYALATEVTNALGHAAYTQYDYYTGQAVNFEDANGTVTSLTYGQNDPLDRLSQVVRAANYAAESSPRSQTTYAYDDADRKVTTTSDLRSYGDNLLRSEAFYDGLGRATEARRYEDATRYVATLTRYDALGRPSEVSNPYRPLAQPAESPVWTQTSYDALGRMRSVTTPDGARVYTLYDGARALVTDQAGKQRLGKSDALGRLTEVWEVRPPDAATGTEAVSFPVPQQLTTAVPAVSSGYRTVYAYDVLGNLRRVEQGTQRRHFLYDSLGRLVRAKNPEQGTMPADSDFPTTADPASGNAAGDWSAGYAYDAAGNLRKRRDARGVTTSYGYDALGRNTLVHYDDAALGTAHHTTDVVRSYDGAALGKGLPWKTETAGLSATVVDSYDEAGRPKQQTQKFWTGAGWGQSPPYSTGLEYNLAGGVTRMAYPSGNWVEYRYDAAGRLGDNGALPAFRGTLGDGAERTYASQVSYSEFGGIREERFGTQVPLYHKLHYNRRGQLYDIRLSTAGWATDQWGWDRGAVVNYYAAADLSCATDECRAGSGPDNNGNLRRQQTWVPSDDQMSGGTFTQQTYEYDALNRLSSVAEAARAGDGVVTDSFRQAYDYDRWGNRTVNAAGTWLGQPTAPPGEAVNEKQFDGGDLSSTNRLYAPGDTVLPMSQRRMRYDAAGNLTYDGYTGKGTRAYDAEDRMTAAADEGGGTASYAYDGDGRRVKRMVGGAGEVWQVYGPGGELLAEYAKESLANRPRKEYGYRGGELLVTAEAAGGWGPAPAFTDESLARKVVQALYVTELREAVDSLRAHKGMAAYQWRAVAAPRAPITAESFLELRRALDEALGAPAAAYTAALEPRQPIRAVFIEELRKRVLDAWQGGAACADVRWLVADQLGTPRMVVDRTGRLAGVTRHDYLPFGEEISAGTGGRITTQGYSRVDNVRQKYTGLERDEETELDFAEARYYSSPQGRFTSVDPLQASATTFDPQTWNRYTYSLNNPLRYTDPTGLDPQDTFKANNPCAMGQAGCHPVDMGTVTTIGTTQSPIEQTVGVIADTLVDFGSGIPAGMAGALSFGNVGGPRPTDSLANRLGQVVGDVVVGVISYDVAAGGTGVTVLSGGSTAVVSVPAAVAGVAGVAGAVTNAVGIVTTPIQMGSSTLKPGPHAGESIPARGPDRNFTPGERQSINKIGNETGCHTCGSTNPGTKSGDFIPDHQPPNKLNPEGRPQRLYPHCLGCSKKQGGEVRTATRRPK